VLEILNKSADSVAVILHSHTSHTAAISYLTSLFLPCIRIVHRRVDFKIKKGLSPRFKYLKSDGIIAVSKAIKQIMVSAQIPEKTISVIPDSIDMDEIPFKAEEFENYRKKSREKLSESFRIPKDTFWIGSLIALVPHKDPENFLRSAKLVLEKYPQVQFMIAGDGILKDKMHLLIKELNIKNFHLLGFYNNPLELLSSLDIFVLPSVEEGMGSVLLEAMCSRLPIVATDAGGIPEVIENNVHGLIVPKKNPQELAKAQISLIENEELRKKFAENGFKKSSEFSSEKMAKLTLKFYEETIENLKHT
jgi:glycosyltransferase involved in cell wall biosynthesis